LLFGKVPSNFELKMFISTLKEYQHLPDEFIEDFILRKPSTDIMNQLQRSVLCLYTLDENPDDVSLSNLIDQSLNLIAKFPSLLVYCYQACNYKHFNKSLIIHNPVEEYSIAGKMIYHFDLYRLADPEELEFMGIRDYFSQNCICLIEWAEKGEGILPEADLLVNIDYYDDARNITLIAQNSVGEHILTQL